jgi:hypothetical protein
VRKACVLSDSTRSQSAANNPTNVLTHAAKAAMIHLFQKTQGLQEYLLELLASSQIAEADAFELLNLTRSVQPEQYSPRNTVE